MKKLSFMLLAVMFILSSTISAQISNDTAQDLMRPRYENRWTAKNRAQIMAEQLKLTDEEKAQVEALFEKQDKERAAQVDEQRAKREGLRKEREVRRSEMQELREKAVSANDAELEKIIGKEKLDQWKKFREDNRRVRRPSVRMR